MGKVRVYELAKELNMGNKDLVQRLQEMGYPVKSHSSTIESFLVQEIKSRILGKKAQTPAATAGRPTVIRRRKKVVEPPPVDDTAPDIPIAVQPEAVSPGIGPAPEEEAPPAEPVIHEAAAQEARPEAEAPIIGEVEEKQEVQPEDDFRTEVVEGASLEAEAIETTELQEQPVSEEVPAGIDAAEPGPREVWEETPAIGADQAVETAPEESEAVAEKVFETKEPGVPVPESDQIETEPSPVDEGVALAPEPRKAKGKKPIRIEQRIKRIEKTTAEPAKIISRPKVVEPPKIQPVPPPVEKPVQEAPPAGPRPVAPTRPKPKPVDAPPEIPPLAVVPASDQKKTKKKKKGRESQAVEEESRGRKGTRRREIIERIDLYDESGATRPARGRKSARAVKKSKHTEITTPRAIKRRIKLVDVVTVAELAKKMGAKAVDLIRKLMSMGLVVQINQAIDFETAVLVAAEFGYDVEKDFFDEDRVLQPIKRDDSELATRPPVVTVMGHVDHGKTSLLDFIRHANVIEGEAGGITQHIGAYHVNLDGGDITFLDTPGHEAFTAMRARGAQVTDIVVLIVAADDGVMQQTREAADHARAAGVPIIVAVNKIDKPDAEPDRIRREMADLGLVPEAWGGDTIFADVSAKTGQGVGELLELILLQAEVLELKASADGRAQGRVIEARLDKGRGPVATILVQSGRLKQGDPYVCGVHHGKVRAMFDDKGQRVETAGPAIPVEIQGISGVPQAGDEFVAVEDDKKAKQVSQHRQLKQRESELLKTSKVTLETLFDSMKEGIKELNLVLKTDVQGSLEAIADALMKLTTEEIKINLITSSTGAISETDIMLASASEALVVGFNVRPNAKVQELADSEKIQIRYYNVIYKLIDDIKEAMAGLLEPIHEEHTMGRAMVRDTFQVSKVGTIAGCAVTDGKVVRGANARLLRDDVVIYDGRIDSLKRFKDDAREVLSGYECGIGLEHYNDIKVGDVIEAYSIEEVAATLD